MGKKKKSKGRNDNQWKTTARNKVKHITIMLETAGGSYKDYLLQRLEKWKKELQ